MTAHKAGFIFLASLLVLPAYVYAQSSGLVPCGAVPFGNYLGATACNFCYLAKLIQNIVNFLVMVSIPISVGLFAWAGILYFTNAGNPKRVSQAHRIFRSVLIGFIITASGWLSVQIVLQTITNADFYRGTSWFDLPCDAYNADRPRDLSISQIFSGVVSTPTPTPNPNPTPSPNDPTNPGGSGPTYTDSQARDELRSVGISVNKPDCPTQSSTDCTSLGGIQAATVSQVINLQQACGCSFVVTGGTEAGHAAGVTSHASGYKVDISLGAVDSYIQSTMTPIGTRSDGAPMWKDSHGNTYAKEGNHWDIQVNKAGPLQTRPQS